MQPFKVIPFTKDIVVRFSKSTVQLSSQIQDKVDAYWDRLIAGGKSFQRGEVFTVTHKDISQNCINILVEKTDYAHFLYSQNVDPQGKDSVHIIHTASIVETIDDYLIFGKMGVQTAQAGHYQLCGGGIDNADLRGDHFDLTHNISKELREELNIDVGDSDRVKKLGMAYFKDGGPTDKMSVIYRVTLSASKDTFLSHYTAFEEGLRASGEEPEFGKIVALKKEKSVMEQFLAENDSKLDEYMRPLFEQIISEMAE